MKKYKIKIKVGHIVIALVSLLLIFPGVVYVIGSSLVGYGENTYSINKRYYGAATMELYTKLPKIIPQDGEVYYELATSYYDVIGDKWKYSNTGWHLPETGNEKRVRKAIDNFKRGLELGEDDEYYAENISMLINTYVALGERDEAIKYINIAKSSASERVSNIGKINEIILLVKDGEVDKALELCKRNIEKYDFYVLYLNLLYNYGDVDEYNEAFKKRVIEVDQFKSSLKEGEYSGYINYVTTNDNGEEVENKNKHLFLREDIDLLKYVDFKCYLVFHEREEGTNIIEGTLVKCGDGIPYQRVTNESYIYFNREGNIGDLVERSTYTNKYGYYKVDNIPNGKYGIAVVYQGYLGDNSFMYLINGDEFSSGKEIELNKSNMTLDFEIKPYSIISTDNFKIEESENWLTFKFPNIKDATKLKLNFACDGYGYEFSFNLDKYKEQVRIPLANKRFIFYDIDNSSKYDPVAHNIVGTIKDKNVYIGFTFYDKDGFILEQTEQKKFKFKVKGGNLNQGDKLILNEQYEEGIKWYNERIEEEGNKREYLYPLLRYYCNYGYVDKDKGTCIREYEKYYKVLENTGIEGIEERNFRLWSSNLYE